MAKKSTSLRGTLHLCAGCGLGCIRLMFEYLSMLRHAGPQAWAYQEMATIAGMKFKSVQ